MTTKLIALLAVLAVANLAASAPMPPSPSSSSPLSKRSHVRIRPELSHSEYTVAPPASVSALVAPKGTPAEIAAHFVTKSLSIPATEFRVVNVVPVSNGATAVHLRQVINGLDVANADMNINVAKSGKILSYGDSFFRGPRPAGAGTMASFAATTKVTPHAGFEALAKAVNLPLDGKKVEVQPSTAAPVSAAGVHKGKQYTIKTDAALSDVPVKQVYIQNGDKLALTYEYSVELDGNWYNGHVNAKTGEVEQIVDWVADAKYNGVPVGRNSPDDGGIEVMDSSTIVDTKSSPFGWHNQGNGKKFTDTRGNNAYTQENLSGGKTVTNNKRPDGGAALDFTAYAPDFDAEPKDYTEAATAQLFVIVNQVHDITYKYGFDEKSGNFQQNNFAKGGAGNDAVFANAQDGADVDNADFGTPPDGQSGKMRMFVFTSTKPNRDGTFDTAVPIHEYGHGISTRLTGGPANSNCLNSLLAMGMGEGWSDSLAFTLNAKASDTRTTPIVAGAYVAGSAAGIRTYPYSTSTSVNPTMYNYLASRDYQEEHMAGEVWATTLFEVYWSLVGKLGFGDIKAGFSASNFSGNQLFLQVMLDAMKLQPCNPTFINARDAFLLAEKNLTGGKYACDIWKGFAKRGLGVGAGTASQKFKNSSKVPATCSN